jgi:propanol-preferring alcohol dehydrogenase
LPEPLDRAVTFASAGELMAVALRALARGGSLAVRGIYLSDVPALSYADTLFRNAGCAASPPIPVRTGRSSCGWPPGMNHRDRGPVRLRRRDRALADLAHGRFSGAAVLHVDGSA